MSEDREMLDDEADEAVDAAARGHVDREHVHGITREQWSYWHSHPVTRLMREYLREYAISLEQAALQRWRERTLVLADEHEIRNRIVQIAEIEKLAFDDVKQFYEEPKE
jgi:hypothetical protein